MAMACTHRRPDATREAPAVIAVRIKTGRFPASGSRKRLTMFRVTPSATPEHNLGWLDSSSMPHVLRRFLRPSLTEALVHLNDAHRWSRSRTAEWENSPPQNDGSR